MSSRKNLSNASKTLPKRLLRISEVAQRVGISSSALRAWEALGLVVPQRTESHYRLYTDADVRLLQRAIFLRRARGLNPPAIVHILKKQGVVSAPVDTRHRCRTAIPSFTAPSKALSCHGGTCNRSFRRIPERAGTWPDALLYFDAAPYSSFLQNQYNFAFRDEWRTAKTRSTVATQNSGDLSRRSHGTARLGQHFHGAPSVSDQTWRR